jgi:2-polyprenyl-6-methoxyphenol hydroxylase-like FAD-dependent oxidoreductase
MKNLRNVQIAIAGGGPGGLTLARLLQQRGATVKVYERDADRNARVQGTTLDLHEESGLKALQVAGLMDAFRKNYRPDADKIRIVDKKLHVYLDEHTDPNKQEMRPEIDRGPLRELLIDSLEPDTIVWNSRVTALHPEGKGWNVQFDNGNTAYADLVVAADGANSKLRPYLTPIRPFFAGVTAVEGVVYDAANVIPELTKLVAGGKIFAMDDSKTLIIGAKGDGSMAFYTCQKSTEHWLAEYGVDMNNKEQMLSWFDKEFAGWDPAFRTLFENAKTPFIPRPQYCMPIEQNWKAQANLTMIGDAAHLMPPFAGEGVNMAMLDALELAEHLADNNYADLKAAISAFEEGMRARMEEITTDTLYWTDLLHSPAGRDQFLDVMTSM